MLLLGTNTLYFIVAPAALGAAAMAGDVEARLATTMPPLKDPIALPILATIVHLFVVQYLALGVNAARAKYHVPWPFMYAERGSGPEAVAYNCCQRAHQYTLEQSMTLFPLLAIGTLEFPLTAGLCSLLYTSSKVVGNVIGYASGVAIRKNRAAYGYAGLYGLVGLAGATLLRRVGV